MNERDMFLKTWEREFQTTLKVLKTFPTDKLEFKPHERSMSARNLAWSFPMEDRMAVLGAANGPSADEPNANGFFVRGFEREAEPEADQNAHFRQRERPFVLWAGGEKEKHNNGLCT